MLNGRFVGFNVWKKLSHLLSQQNKLSSCDETVEEYDQESEQYADKETRS